MLTFICVFFQLLGQHSLNLNPHRGYLLQLSHLIANKMMLLVRILSSLLQICLESAQGHFHALYSESGYGSRWHLTEEILSHSCSCHWLSEDLVAILNICFIQLETVSACKLQQRSTLVLQTASLLAFVFPHCWVITAASALLYRGHSVGGIKWMRN